MSQALPPQPQITPLLTPASTRQNVSLCVADLVPAFLLSDIEAASDIALYSGLGAAVIAVAVLVVGVTLYRRSQSEYGVDVIDSSALTGGFQTFNFKTVRQG